MSIMMRADLSGDMVIGEVEVWIVSFGEEGGLEWEVGWVRSKPV
jgi:hypothetical protein